MINSRENIENKKNKKDYTWMIIFGLIFSFFIGLGIFLINYNAKVEGAKLFERAQIKIDEFDKLPNIYSKKEMEKEVINLLDNVIAKYPATISGKRAFFYKGYILFNAEDYEKAETNF